MNKINSDFDCACDINGIEIHWWGKSRAKNIRIEIDQLARLSYEEQDPPPFNGWRKFDNLDLKVERTMTIQLSNGVKDIWNMGILFGIRSISIIGRLHERNSKLKLLRDAFAQTTEGTENQEVRFLAAQFLEKEHFSKWGKI